MIEEQLTALGDQVQAACAASGLEVLGFSIFVNNHDKEVVTTESRSAIPRTQYMQVMRIYTDAERNDPRDDEVPA